MFHQEGPKGFFPCKPNSGQNGFPPPQSDCRPTRCPIPDGCPAPRPNPPGPRGPRGIQGPQGPQGPTGPAGASITGATGPQGPSGETGPSETIQIRNTTTGEPGSNATVTDVSGAPDHVLDFVIPRGATGPAGATGTAGATGPTGATGITGATGPTGAEGERGPIAATIPFSLSNVNSSGAQISTDAQGNPETIAFAGFGGDSGYGLHLQPGEWASGSVTITQSYAYPSSFIMPFDGTLRNIYALFANRSELNLDEGVTMRPFVCLGISNSNALVFNILQDTIVYTAPFVGGTSLPKYSVRRGSLLNLDIPLPAGTLVTVIGGWVGEGVTSEQSTQVSFSGGLYID